MEKPIDQNNQLVIIEEKIQRPNNETKTKKYLRGQMLGKGGFAKCYEVTDLESKRIQAAKIIPKETLQKTRARQKLISEIKIHKSLQHLHVVQFEHVFEDYENVYILLELCTNNTLNELIKRRKRLTELEVQCYLLQIINGLKYLHQNKVIHRDLKLGNLFINDKMEIKLGDFGLATKLEFDGEKKNTICGTPNYIAPEILEGKTGHSYQVDIWSLGVIIYTLIIGKPPYETPDVKATYKKIRQNSYSFPENIPISDDAKNLIVKILNLEPLKRPTLDEILLHPFMNNNGTIPKTLPVVTLNCPPSIQYTKQFLPQGNALKVNQQPVRLIESSNNNRLKTQSTTQINKPSINTCSDQIWGLSTNGQQSQKNIPTNSEFKPFSTQGCEFKKNSMTKSTNMNNYACLQSTNNFLSTKNGIGSNQKIPNNENIQEQQVWVIQWVDYSAKYGLGYILSNGHSGVFFNDSTKIILDPSSNQIEYMERKYESEKQDSVIQFNLDEYPPELKKKVTLLSLFRNYLKEQKQNNQMENFQKTQNFVYVKKWMKTKHAIMFRLSNKIVQVSFVDKTEILLSSEQKMVTYLDKKGNRSNYPLATALENQNTEMSKRLKYTKDILTQILDNKTKAKLSNINLNMNDYE
ncbi:polo-like kinase 1, putative [Ichthyophthirius multifiliis]|uniref:Polo-like kinase 1, putative n=1 Tax=Ichthyophthirius multifiliis TaxID=5932 RepID=G0QMQ9_ICHMU|nr:polo-like kinase 1, putative [Ichthyophthirius multifiliis]EGR33498.1 polo-like kinase 1, putative [Ichthyophthirius multifiliis]|eukprot:XP_004037484.1 polo-like kinase 1, putative [Ichthyophthirius multifiliis]